MKYVEQKYKKDNIQVQFTEDEDAAFYALKDGEEYFLCVAIKIHELDENGKKKFLGRYFREFEQKVSSVSYNKFVQKFLTDPTYREEFHTDGEKWTGIIEFKTEKGVNQKCLHQIQRINSGNMKRLNFKDFANLKTYGLDSFSRVKLDKLLEIVPQADANLVNQAFQEEKHVVATLRWIARGLKTEHAIRKTKTDLEIQNNMR
ncbi:hypothetical protein COA01_23280 [Bacillus cereus]|uniref:hypothetical protein n=1 Tax=Bacillus cereus TaxID=1396 RepID=UPI000BFD1EA7|nr:hypothetical protein [Bacillus cereus]PGP18668.1 hypothetical protein COA01_23280 [Bacillus cereus]